MILESLVVGPIATNCYLVGKGPEVAIVDPGGSEEAVFNALEEKGLRPAAIVATHAHADHILGLTATVEKYPGIKVYAHEAEKEFYANPAENLSMFIGESLVSAEPTDFLEDGQVVEIAGLEFRVLHIPGHSPGGICLFHQPAEGDPFLLAGDTVFQDSIGRTDFPHSDHNLFISKIKNSILTLPDNTTILPGHGPATTVEHEKSYNPFLR